MKDPSGLRLNDKLEYLRSMKGQKTPFVKKYWFSGISFESAILALKNETIGSGFLWYL